MLKLFKRRRPAHKAQPIQISPEDRLIAALHGLTPERRNELPPLAKADKREQVAWETRQAS